MVDAIRELWPDYRRKSDMKQDSAGTWSRSSTASPEQMFFATEEHFSCCVPNCTRDRSEHISSVPLCDEHGIEVVRDVHRFRRLIPDRDLYPERVLLAPPRLPAPKDSQVYYVLIEPGVVKIGVTIQLVDRIASFRLSLDKLMATEPGGLVVERRRHNQFAEERVGRMREHFTLSDRLREHIALMRATHDTKLTRSNRTAEVVVIPRVG